MKNTSWYTSLFLSHLFYLPSWQPLKQQILIAISHLVWTKLQSMSPFGGCQYLPSHEKILSSLYTQQIKDWRLEFFLNSITFQKQKLLSAVHVKKRQIFARFSCRHAFICYIDRTGLRFSIINNIIWLKTNIQHFEG